MSVGHVRFAPGEGTAAKTNKRPLLSALDIKHPRRRWPRTGGLAASSPTRRQIHAESPRTLGIEHIHTEREGDQYVKHCTVRVLSRRRSRRQRARIEMICK